MFYANPTAQSMSSRPTRTVSRPLSLCIALVATNVAIANDAAELLIVHQETSPVAEAPFDNAEVALENGSPIKRGTMVLGLRKDNATQARWLVKVSEGGPQQGWVSASDVTPFSSYVRELEARAIALRSDENPKSSSLPALIALQENPAIRKAWKRVADVIAENEKLPPEERLPDPYFARAEIWSSARNYFAALQDYLTGIRCARTSGRDVASYSAYFGKLAAVAKKLESNPVPATGTAAHWREIAKMHYSLGFTDYFSGAHKDALTHFDNCVSLAPDEPLYWYFRALTHRALGEAGRARHDALIGAHFEKDSYGERRTMAIRLTRVQGPDRGWLERHRVGLVHFHLLSAHRGSSN